MGEVGKFWWVGEIFVCTSGVLFLGGAWGVFCKLFGGGKIGGQKYFRQITMFVSQCALLFKTKKTFFFSAAAALRALPVESKKFRSTYCRWGAKRPLHGRCFFRGMHGGIPPIPPLAHVRVLCAFLKVRLRGRVLHHGHRRRHPRRHLHLLVERDLGGERSGGSGRLRHQYVPGDEMYYCFS